ncbi:MAG: sensor histidine kinase [Oscillochloridaceae bacterium umkhey_bin13]
MQPSPDSLANEERERADSRPDCAFSTAAPQQDQQQASAMLQQIKQTLDQTHDCIFIFDPVTLRFFYVNQGAINQVGYSREELLTMSPLEIKPELDAARFQAMIASLLAGEQSFYNFETVHRHKAGHDIPVEIALQYVSGDGAPGRFVAIVRDISEHRRHEAARAKRNQELDQFAYVASHDLKAPLRGIANLAQWLEEDLGENISPETRKYLELMRNRVRRMEGLINGLLQYSRVGRAQTSVTLVDVQELIAEVLDLLDPPAATQIQIPERLPIIRTDRVLLHQVFANLLGNALKHGQVTNLVLSISVQQSEQHYIFHIRDNGQGIAPRFHERIFGIFQTLASRDEVEGSGVGLALVKKIIEHQGGQIWVTSDIGEGATFSFSWPISPVA